MKATKTTMTITIEVLSVDNIQVLISDAVEHIRSEFLNGSLTASDGAHVEWNTEQKDVEF